MKHGARLAAPKALVTLAIVALGLGCSSIFGIDDWEDPHNYTTPVDAGAGDGDAEAGPRGCEHEDPLNATCADCVKNGLETDIDCGGDACSPCAIGLHCLNNADCASGNCANGICAEAVAPTCPPLDPDGGPGPTCADCVQNGLETDVDCGGDACPPCAAGKRCQNDADCMSGHCAGGVCG